jgi:hypothetical protein
MEDSDGDGGDIDEELEDGNDLYSSKVAKKSKTNNLQLAMTVTAEEEDTTEQQDKWIDLRIVVAFGQLASFNDFIFTLSLGLTNES